MISRIWIAAGLAMVIAMAVAFWGCETDDGSNGGLGNSTFMVQFLSSSTDSAFVIIQDVNTDSVLDMKGTTKPGTVSFSNLPFRATVTIVSASAVHADLTTYQNVAMNTHWVEGYSDSMLIRIGSAVVNASYPRVGAYGILRMSNSFSGAGRNLSESDCTSTTMVLSQILSNDAGKFSVFGVVYGDRGAYFGWNLDRTFSYSDTNRYQLTLDRPAQRRSISLADNVGSPTLVGMRTTHGIENLIWEEYGDYYPDSGMSIYWRSDLPVDHWAISGTHNNDDSVWVSYGELSTGFPSSFAIPPRDISLSYNAPNLEFSNIQLVGNPSVIMATWKFNPDSGVGYTYWEVLAAPSTHSLHPPTLPASLRSKFLLTYWQAEPLDFRTEEYYPSSGYDAFISMEQVQQVSDHLDFSHVCYCEKRFSEIPPTANQPPKRPTVLERFGISR